jgi:hypothetical protein
VTAIDSERFPSTAGPGGRLRGGVVTNPEHGGARLDHLDTAPSGTDRELHVLLLAGTDLDGTDGLDHVTVEGETLVVDPTTTRPGASLHQQVTRMCRPV